jgi:hypothetical protein
MSVRQCHLKAHITTLMLLTVGFLRDLALLCQRNQYFLNIGFCNCSFEIGKYVGCVALALESKER